MSQISWMTFLVPIISAILSAIVAWNVAKQQSKFRASEFVKRVKYFYAQQKPILLESSELLGNLEENYGRFMQILSPQERDSVEVSHRNIEQALKFYTNFSYPILPELRFFSALPNDSRFVDLEDFVTLVYLEGISKECSDIMKKLIESHYKLSSVTVKVLNVENLKAFDEAQIFPELDAAMREFLSRVQSAKHITGAYASEIDKLIKAKAASPSPGLTADG